jgi:hypothetical protein
VALRPFDVIDSATVARWATTAEEASLWCGHAGWPAPSANRWSTEDGVRAWLTRPVGYRAGRVEP